MPPYISGVGLHFQHCSKFAYIFFTLHISKKTSTSNGAGARLPKYVPVDVRSLELNNIVQRRRSASYNSLKLNLAKSQEISFVVRNWKREDKFSAPAGAEMSERKRVQLIIKDYWCQSLLFANGLSYSEFQTVRAGFKGGGQGARAPGPPPTRGPHQTLHILFLVQSTLVTFAYIRLMHYWRHELFFSIY